MSPRGFLEGVRVCIMRAGDLDHDARARKQAASFAAAGANVTLVGVGTRTPEDLTAAGYAVVMTDPQRGMLKPPRLGRPDVWWPLRVGVNLTYTKALAWRHQARLATLASPNEHELYEAALLASPHIVHAYNIHTLQAAVRVKRATGAAVVYDCRDLFTDYEIGDDEGRARYRRLESELISEVDAVIAVSDSLGEILQERYGVMPVSVYNGPLEVVSHARPAHTPVRLLFTGAFNQNRNLDTLIMAMKGLEGRATLALQGFGGVEEALRDLVLRLGLERCVSFPAPADPLSIVTSAAEYDVGVICSIAHSLNMRVSVSNKLMDYLGAGLAVAATDLPGHRRVLDGTGAAIFVDPTSPDTVRGALDALVCDPERITRMKRAALSVAARYEWSVQEVRLMDVYESIAESRFK